MMTLKNRIYHLSIIISMMIVIDLISFGIAESANSTQIIIDENLKPGMTLKDAIQLLGPPETMKVSDTGTIIIPYKTFGLSIEVKRDGIVIEKIHVLSSFKGKFASGITIGEDYQKILSVYDQPDFMTKEIIEYSELGRRFQLRNGKLTGVDLYAGKSKSDSMVSDKEAGKHEEIRKAVAEEVHGEIKEEVREALREEMRDEVREELREEVREEVNKEFSEDFDVFALYGFKVKMRSGSVIISEIEPGSVAEKGGLEIGEPIRKAFYEGAGINNIYYVRGLKAVLKRAVVKRKKIINILQDNNYYYKVEVPRIK